MKKKYLVKLTEPELRKLEVLVQKGKAGARTIRRAHMLMLAHEGKKAFWKTRKVARKGKSASYCPCVH